MTRTAYEKLSQSDLTLADYLALERTSLANERTLLAYLRTMVGIIAVGGTLLKFFTDWFVVVTGWAFLVLGVFILLIGLARYVRTYLVLHAYEKDPHERLFDDKLHSLIWSAIQKLHIF